MLFRLLSKSSLGRAFKNINSALSEENENLKAEKEHLRSMQYNFENVSSNPEQFSKFTGLALDKFMLLVILGPKWEHLKIYETLTNAKPSRSKSYTFKSGPNPKLDAIDQLLMFLVWLKNGFPPQSHIGWLFGLPKLTVFLGELFIFYVMQYPYLAHSTTGKRIDVRKQNNHNERSRLFRSYFWVQHKHFWIPASYSTCEKA